MFIVFKRENKTQTISNLAFHLLEIKTIGIYAVSFGSRGAVFPQRALEPLFAQT